MKKLTKQCVFYAVYLVFVMAVTTTAIIAISGKSGRGQCYVMRDKELVYVNCPCQCLPGDRDSTGMFCKRCEHHVDERLESFPHSDDLPVEQQIGG